VKIPFYGLTSFLIVEVVIEANKSPNENKQYFLMPFAFKSKYYPLVIFLVLVFLTGFDIFPLIAGLIVGYLHTWKIVTFCYDLNKACVERLEENCLFGLLKKAGGFYSAGIAEEYIRSDGDRLPIYDRNEPISNTIKCYSAKNKPFKGEGVRVGEEEKRLSEAIRKAEGRRPVSRLVQEHEIRSTNSEDSLN
jgi:hypothetical protein